MVQTYGHGAVLDRFDNSAVMARFLYQHGANTGNGQMALEYSRICMQKKNSLCPEFCGSSATEEVSFNFCIMIELSHDLQDLSRDPRKPTPGRKTFKGKHPEGVGVGLSNDVPPQEKPFQNQKHPCSTPYKSFVEW